MTRIGLTLSLALADLRHERGLALTAAIACAAVLAPLIVLFGLKAGVVAGLRAELIQNPRAREILNTQNRGFDAAWFRTQRERPEIAFIVPRTRTLSGIGNVEIPDRPGETVRAELIGTAPGDPLLRGLPQPEGSAVVVSAALAVRLGLAGPADLSLRIVRIVEGRRETMVLPVRALAIAPPAAFGREGLFLPLPLLLLAEDFQDGLIEPDERTPAIDPEARQFAGFRLYARALEDVVALDQDFRRQNIEISTRAEEIAGLIGLDRNLALLFTTIAVLGGAGYLVSLGLSLWANVARKRRELALLRLSGLSAAGLAAFPVAQAAVTAAAGSLLAAALALSVAWFVNRLSFGARAEEFPVCLILPEHLGVAAGATLAGAMLAALVAGLRAARVEPAEGIRE
jgi:putative ABC transport system permease protein